MSKYTTEVRFLCETFAGLTESKGYNDTKNIIAEARTHIFDFDYPIYDPSYKSVLESKILRHYYTREISEETYGLWKLRLEDRMNVIMPYYNQLYRSAMIEFNPMYDVDLTTKHEGSGTGIQESNVGTNGSNSSSGENKERENINENGVVSGDKNFENNESNDNENTHTGSVTDKNNRSEAGINSDNRTGIRNEEGNGFVNNEYEGENTEVGSSDNHEKGTTGNSRTNDTNGTQWNLFSDTPQGGIEGIEGTVIGTDEFKYLTTATKNTDTQHEHEVGSTSSENYNEGTQVNSGSERFNNKENSEDKRKIENSEEGSSVSNLSAEENNVRDYDEKIKHKGSSKNSGIEDYSEVKNNEIGRERSGENSLNNEYNESRNESVNSMTTDEYLQNVSGKSGGVSYSSLLMEYRETFINIDEMIIEELSDLFFGLW